MRSFFLIFLLFLLPACTTEQVIDLEQLEIKARGGDPQAIEQLVDLLGSGEEGVADRIYPVIIDIGPGAVSALLPQVQSTDKQRREYVIAALGTLKVVDAVSPISRTLAETKLKRRYVAAWALGEIGTKECIPPLLGALNDSNSEVRRYATRALIKLNRTAVLPLIEYLDSARGEGAAGAIRALGDIADRRALDVLIEQSQTEQRADAYLALGKLRAPEAEPFLIAGLSDSDTEARMNAAMALGHLGGVKATKSLTEALDDEVHVVREWAARSLEKITGEPVLYRNSHDEYVRPYQVYH